MKPELMFLGLVVLGTACAGGSSRSPGVPGSEVEVQPGIEVLLERPPTWLLGKRIGLITNHAGIDRQGNRTIDLLSESKDLDLVALFAFEHGISGAAPPGQQIASGVDLETGLPIHSLYGDTHEPTAEMLEGVDVLMYDVQDVGARPYTRVSTMALSMQAAAEKGIPFMVLDRPNPLGGVAIEGNLLEPEFASFVGMYPIPMRHGMTLGELARMYNVEFDSIGAELTVVPMAGWRRDLWFDETGLPWVNPSPNIRRLAAANLYPGMVLLEGTNLSEGRGTDLPFEQTGAPWLRAQEVADSLNALGLPGIGFDPVRLAISPDARKFPGQTIPGVRFIVTDREVFEPVSTGIHVISLIRRLHPDHFEFRPYLDRLAGTSSLRSAIESGTVQQLIDGSERDAQRFGRTREKYLLYH